MHPKTHKPMRFSANALALALLAAVSACCAPGRDMHKSELFAELPDCCPTPDGMAAAPDGKLAVACPNFADTSKPGCLIKVDRNGNVEKWTNLPPHPETGLACPMGIAFDEDGDIYVADNQGWAGTPEGRFKGRILRLKIDGGRIAKCTVVASGMEHPNGIRYRDGMVYVTQSLMSKVKHPSNRLTSGVYRFSKDDENVEVSNTLDDANLIAWFLTFNPECQYGMDGIVFDASGNLLVGNFGDGSIHKITFNPDGSVAKTELYAQNPAELRTVDGMCADSEGNIIIADFSENAVAVMDKCGNIRRIAQSPDSDGANGELDQPGEPIVWEGNIIVSCFDCVTGPDKVNTAHDRPFTLAKIKWNPKAEK